MERRDDVKIGRTDTRGLVSVSAGCAHAAYRTVTLDDIESTNYEQVGDEAAENSEFRWHLFDKLRRLHQIVSSLPVFRFAAFSATRRTVTSDRLARCSSPKFGSELFVCPRYSFARLPPES
jgi:hypothetical protein